MNLFPPQLTRGWAKIDDGKMIQTLNKRTGQTKMG